MCICSSHDDVINYILLSLISPLNSVSELLFTISNITSLFDVDKLRQQGGALSKGAAECQQSDQAKRFEPVSREAKRDGRETVPGSPDRYNGRK